MPVDVGPVELPVTLTVGAGAGIPLGSVHVALRAVAEPVLDGNGHTVEVHVAPVDEHDLRHQLAELLERQVAALRLPVLDAELVEDATLDDEGVPGAAPRR